MDPRTDCSNQIQPRNSAKFCPAARGHMQTEFCRYKPIRVYNSAQELAKHNKLSPGKHRPRKLQILLKTAANAPKKRSPRLDRCPRCWKLRIRQSLHDGNVPVAVQKEVNHLSLLLWRKTATDTSRAEVQAPRWHQATVGSKGQQSITKNGQKSAATNHCSLVGMNACPC